jgi:sortase (surface protein transpeptidase)
MTGSLGRGRGGRVGLAFVGLVGLAVLVALVALVALVGPLAGDGHPVAYQGAVTSSHLAPAGQPASPAPASVETVAPAAPVSDSASTVSPAARPAVPVSVAIPALGVRSRLLRLGVDRSGVLVPPEQPELAGWFAAGPAPGERGPALIAGHRDSKTGPAVFYRLGELRRGDLIDVGLAGGREVRFRVQEVRRFPKDQFPAEAAYGPTPDRALRLVTCGGAYVRSAGGYQDNVVVFALAER